jgi:hypothetical protein
MSIPVELGALRDEIERFGEVAYLLSVGDDGRPHAVHVRVAHERGALTVAAGGRTARNAAERPLVALLWPPVEDGGHSLIVDAEASGADEGGRLRLRPDRAVLHRPAP